MSDTPPDDRTDTQTNDRTDTPMDDRTDTQTDDRTAGETDRDAVDVGTMKWVSGFVSLVGLWILVSPFVFESTETAVWNNAAVGAAVLLLAGYNYYRMSNGLLASVGISSLVALLGLWAIASPFVIEMGTEELIWSTAIAGVVVAALSGYVGYANQQADMRARTGTRT